MSTDKTVKRYSDGDNISDQDINNAFAHAGKVVFSARPNNSIEHRMISFGNLGWWLPLSRVLPIIGVTPQMLRPVFNPQFEHRVKREQIRRQFPFNFSWFGLNKNQFEIKEDIDFVWVELPERIESYDDLGSFPLDETRFCALAKILGKPIEVLREDGGTGEHHKLFVAYPDGRISKS